MEKDVVVQYGEYLTECLIHEYMRGALTSEQVMIMGAQYLLGNLIDNEQARQIMRQTRKGGNG